MAQQVYIIPLRNDLDGMNLQVVDLQPNTSQKNSIYDGAGQSGYIKWSFDHPGTTVVDGDSFGSGSTQTQPLANLVAADTTGGGNDVGIPGVAEFGLAAYFRERIDAGAAGARLTAVQAVTAANNLVTAVVAGTAPTAANINTVLNGVVAGSGLALGLSFGTVTDVLSILQGQVYRVRAKTIVTNAGLAVFLPLGDDVTPGTRLGIIAAQTPAQNLTQGTFYAQGSFVARGEPGFRDFLPLTRTGAMNISAGEGVLSHLKADMDWVNPNYAYVAGAVTAWRPRAYSLSGVAVPETGVAKAVVVCDYLGNFI